VTYGSVTLDITGPAQSEAALSGYLAGQPLAPGQPVVHGRYEAVKQELLKRTIDLGYLDASLSTHRVEVDLDSYSADAVIVVDSGPLFRFGEVRLVQDSLRDDYLSRFVEIAPGQRYSDRRLLRVEQDLRNSNYFEEVRVQPRIEQADDGRVPVEIRLTPRKRSEYQAGLGYGTDTGCARLALLAAAPRQPARTPLPERPAAFRDRRVRGGAVHHPLRRPAARAIRAVRKLYRGRARYQRQRARPRRRAAHHRPGPHPARPVFHLPAGGFHCRRTVRLTDLFIPGIGLSRVTADDRLFTRQGLRWSTSLQGTPGLVSDFAFIQPRASGKLIHSFGDLRVILRGEAAYTAAKLEDLPASLRFFAGGDHSVRGFGYQTLGPENEEGEVTGGRQLLVGSAEVDYGVAENWRVAAFVDAGNAFDEFKEPLRKSVGIGIRRITPIGPIRLDLAHPFSGGDSVRLHISLGPDL
jgi:translocation and assembly module TamA